MTKRKMMMAAAIVGAAIGVTVSGGCRKNDDSRDKEKLVRVDLVMRADDIVKSSYSPDEEKISDLNVFFFSADEGTSREPCLEERLFLRSSKLSRTEEGCFFHMKLLSGKAYDIYAAANLGYAMDDVKTLKELKSYRYHLAFPDELRGGIPMSGFARRIIAEEDESGEAVFRLTLRRLMAKVSLSVDRSQLGKGFEYNIKSVRICGSPRSVPLFGSGGASSRNDFLSSGYTRSGTDASVLNIINPDGRSGETSLYCLENVQDGSDTTLCSYMEIEAEYKSDTLRSMNGGCLIYRFYLGSRREPYALRRNHEYRISVMPVGRGLSGDGWRVDTENLEPYSDVFYRFFPSNYIECRIGDTVHIWCEYSPPYARMEIDRSLLDQSVEDGIWTYEIDGDGHGVTFHMKKGGMGMAVFDVYEPVNDGTLFVIMCEP